jgi:hypothetical protein
MKAKEAFVPASMCQMYTPSEYRTVIRKGMRYRRSRRFSLTYRWLMPDGRVLPSPLVSAIWIDLGGEG